MNLEFLAVLIALSIVFWPVFGLSSSSFNPGQQERRQESLDAGRDPLLSLNLNLDALARAKAPDRAQQLFQRISALHEEGYYSEPPNTVSFNTVLKAWNDDPAKALEFWESAEKIPKNIRSYNTFLFALAKSGCDKESSSLLRSMLAINSRVKPDLISWNTVLLAHARSGCANSAPRAELLLQTMLDGQPIQVDYNETSKTFNLTLVQSSYIPPKPDKISINTGTSVVRWLEFTSLPYNRTQSYLLGQPIRGSEELSNVLSTGFDPFRSQMFAPMLNC